MSEPMPEGLCALVADATAECEALLTPGAASAAAFFLGWAHARRGQFFDLDRFQALVPGNDPLRRRGRRRRVLYSWGRLQREPMKCEIVCANCHRVRSCRRSLASLPGGNGKGRRRKAA